MVYYCSGAYFDNILVDISTMHIRMLVGMLTILIGILTMLVDVLTMYVGILLVYKVHVYHACTLLSSFCPPSAGVCRSFTL